jgi:hypothetical protein
MRRPRFALIFGLFGVVIAGCASFPRARDEGGAQWIQVETPHFRLATDMDAQTAVAVAGLLEGWWQAMTLVVGREQGLGHGDGGRQRAPEPFLAIGLRSRWEREGVHYQFGGIFKTFELAPPAISIGDVGDDDGRQTVRHELAHAFLRARLPRIPRWLNEGMAEYLQMAEIDERGHTVTWGVRDASYTRLYGELGTFVPVDRLLDPDSWSGSDYGPQEFYAGLLVHMLVNRHPGELDCYLRKLETDVDLDAAFTSCFPSCGKWSSELGDYKYRRFNTRTAPFDPPAFQPRTTVLGDAQTHAVLAILDLMAASSTLPQFRAEHEQRARGNIHRALELDPTQLWAGLLKLEDPDLAPQSFTDLSAALVRAHPADWRVWVARTRAQGIGRDEQLQAGAQALRLAPDETEVLQVAAIHSLAERKWEEAYAFGNRAGLRGSTTTLNRIVIAVAAGQLGRCPESRSWAPKSTDEKALFKSDLADMHAALGLKDPCR